jgi:hypothetical protein
LKDWPAVVQNSRQGIGTAAQKVDRIAIRQNFDGVLLAQLANPRFALGQPRLPPSCPESNSSSTLSFR